MKLILNPQFVICMNPVLFVRKIAQNKVLVELYMGGGGKGLLFRNQTRFFFLTIFPLRYWSVKAIWTRHAPTSAHYARATTLQKVTSRQGYLSFILAGGGWGIYMMKGSKWGKGEKIYLGKNYWIDSEKRRDMISWENVYPYLKVHVTKNHSIIDKDVADPPQKFQCQVIRVYNILYLKKNRRPERTLSGT